jgi:2'-5' RNA ligase
VTSRGSRFAHGLARAISAFEPTSEEIAMAWFFAVRPDEASRAAILDACATWRREHHEIERLRWTSERKLHYTLRYLGHVDESRLEEVALVLRESTAGVAPFELAMLGFGAFPNPKRPRVVWIGAGEGTERLATIFASLEVGLGRIGFPPDERPYAPHLTVARISERVKFGALAAALHGREHLALGRFRVEAIELMESKPNVDEYATIASSSLRA